MVDGIYQERETIGIPTRQRAVRRVALVLAAAVVFGWIGGFVYLVAVELRTERFLAGAPTIPGRLCMEVDSFDGLLDAVESTSGFTIDVDWRRIPRDETILREAFPRFAQSLLILEPGQTYNGDEVVASLAGVLALNQKGVWRIDAKRRVAFGGDDSAPRIVWFIEGSRVVITTPEGVPAHDASAWARRRWHKVENWWAGL